MQVIRLTLILIIVVLLGMRGQAQVTVSQSFLDDANRAFIEAVAQRKVIAAQDAELKAKDDLIQALQALQKSNEVVITNLKLENDRLRQVTCTESSFLIFIYRTKRCF